MSAIYTYSHWEPWAVFALGSMTATLILAFL